MRRILAFLLAICLLPVLAAAEDKPIVTETSLPGYVVPLLASKSEMKDILASWNISYTIASGYYSVQWEGQWLSLYYNNKVITGFFYGLPETVSFDDAKQAIDALFGESHINNKTKKILPTKHFGYTGISLYSTWYINVGDIPALLHLFQSTTGVSISLKSVKDDRELGTIRSVFGGPMGTAAFEPVGMHVAEAVVIPDSAYISETFLPGYLVPLHINGHEALEAIEASGLYYGAPSAQKRYVYSDEAQTSFSFGGMDGTLSLHIPYLVRSSAYTFADPDQTAYEEIKTWLDAATGLPENKLNEQGKATLKYFSYTDAVRYATYIIMLDGEKVLLMLSSNGTHTTMHLATPDWDDSGITKKFNIVPENIPVMAFQPAISIETQPSGGTSGGGTVEDIKDKMIEDTKDILNGFGK